VGKSSLFNRLVGAERAIVSPIPGTTRDTIEGVTTFEGIPATLVDTAGLRAPRSAIEAEGVRRARAAADEASLTLFVLDASRTISDEERSILEDPPPIVVANKWDIAASGDGPVAGAIPVSAATGEGLPRLRAAIHGALIGPVAMEDPVITDLRQIRALEETVAALERAAGAAALGDEIVVEDLREALRALGSVTGEVGNEDLYDRIFSTFCIGK
jgi:tRNA modification GTPase